MIGLVHYILFKTILILHIKLFMKEATMFHYKIFLFMIFLS